MMPQQHESKSRTIQTMAIALCLLVLLTAIFWEILWRVIFALFSQESADHLAIFQHSRIIFKVSMFMLVLGISVWVGYRLPRRGWFWNMWVVVLFYASLCALLGFLRTASDVTAVITGWGYIESLFLLTMITAAYAGQCSAAKAMPPIWVRPWHAWEARIFIGSALIGISLLASNHLLIQFNKFWPLSKESTMTEQQTGKDNLEIQRFHMAAQTGDFDVINELAEDQDNDKQLVMALFWLLLAQDYGHDEAADHVDDILHITILRYDDDGFDLGQAHYDVMLAHLRGDFGMRPDLGKS